MLQSGVKLNHFICDFHIVIQLLRGNATVI